MRVVHVLRKCDPAAWGGTEMAMQRMLDGLRRQNVMPVIYCPRLEYNDLPDPLVESGYRVERFSAFVPALGLSPQRRRQLVSVGGNLMSFDLIPALWKEKDVSVIHAHTLGRIGGIALTAAKTRNIPFVVTIHGGVLDLPEPLKTSFNASRGNGWEWGRFFGLLFQSHRLFVDAQAIITCNEREAALLRERHPDKRIAVQPHGVDINLYQGDQRQAALAAFPLLANRRILLCLGRVDPVKNQSWLVEQLPAIRQRHPDALLVLAGPCTDEPYGEALHSTVERLGLAPHVLFTGGLPPNDPRLVGLLQLAEVLLLPSLSETFGLVVLESWAAHTPVLASRTSGATALVQDGTNGLLFDLNRPDHFLAALDRLLHERPFALGTAREGHQKVRNEYGIERVARMLKNTYEAVIEEMARVPAETR